MAEHDDLEAPSVTDLDKVSEAIEDFDEHQEMAGLEMLYALADAARSYVALVSGEPSEEMVERMAIACHMAWWGPGDEHPWEKVPDAAKYDYRAGVRAALAAALKGQP